jgi:hypothetical protein
MLFFLAHYRKEDKYKHAETKLPNTLVLGVKQSASRQQENDKS